MSSAEAILEHAARDGSIDIADWPRLLESVLQKLHHIVHNDFPLPSLPLTIPLPPAIDPDVVTSTPPPLLNESASRPTEALPDADADGEAVADENEPPANSQSSTKENNVPSNTDSFRPLAPLFPLRQTHQQVTATSDATDAQPGTLPPDLLSIYQNLTRLLERDFSHSPPYTIQRLAELIVNPRKHYRFLPAYLRALDRIVSVSSPLSDFPLPYAPPTGNGFLTNGEPTPMMEREGLGSDESLGGALLTPIPWLRNNNNNTSNNNAAYAGHARVGGQDGELHSESTETIDGPNGAGSIETVTVTLNGVPSATSLVQTSPAVSPTLSEQSDASTGSSTSESAEAQLRQQGGVTQGELLRQEQEAGVVPVTQHSTRRSLVSGTVMGAGRERMMVGQDTEMGMDEGSPEEIPHARGPELIGMEDMGPQSHPLGGALNLEAAVGRSTMVPATSQPQVATVSSALAKGENEPMKEKEVRMKHASAGPAAETHAQDNDGDVVFAEAEACQLNESASENN